ncbi:hypothetical protein AWW71_29480 [Bacillus cereus]|nr:hypothetical protein AWW71_29480 [Bacillus cereus]
MGGERAIEGAVGSPGIAVGVAASAFLGCIVGWADHWQHRDRQLGDVAEAGVGCASRGWLHQYHQLWRYLHVDGVDVSGRLWLGHEQTECGPTTDVDSGIAGWRHSGHRWLADVGHARWLDRLSLRCLGALPQLWRGGLASSTAIGCRDLRVSDRLDGDGASDRFSEAGRGGSLGCDSVRHGP